MKPCWQKRRSEFNHDWLKNRFMSALASWINLLDDRIEDAALEDSFVTFTLSEWEFHRQEAVALPGDFEREMSPSSLFDLQPLSQCDNNTKQWLGELAHYLWLTRNPVDEWVANATERAKDVDAVYTRLQAALKDCTDVRSAEALRPLRNRFVEFRERCQELARAIEKFPSEVKAT